MASPVRSPRRTKKVIRRTSRSPQRKYSLSQAQPVVQLESKESAYSDPVDSSRALIPNVVFERRDREVLSPQATQLFNSQIIFEDEVERSWLLENMHSTTIAIKVEHNVFTINANHIVRGNQPAVLFLHGFGAGRNWANWIKLAYPLCEQHGYSLILADLPGFGQSSGRNLDQASWKRFGPEIIAGILSSFHLRQSVSVVAQCGGAATIVRTISRYPQWFRGRGLVLSNSVIGDFGELKAGDFEANLTRYNIHIIVFWIPDIDHTKQCVAYKRWNKLRLAGFRNLQLIDLDPDKQTMKLFYPAVRVLNMNRYASKNEAIVYKLSPEFVQQVIDTLNQK